MNRSSDRSVTAATSSACARGYTSRLRTVRHWLGCASSALALAYGMLHSVKRNGYRKGSTSMEAQTPALRIFCAYASEDRAFFHRLEQALGIHRHQGLISLWHHGELLPGSEWDSEIRQQLHAADIILLLISSAFL